MEMNEKQAFGLLLDYIIYLEEEIRHIHSYAFHWYRDRYEIRYEYINRAGWNSLTNALEYALDQADFGSASWDDINGRRADILNNNALVREHQQRVMLEAERKQYFGR